MDTNKQVVVLGMHRSGTSLLSSILQILGVNMGEDLIGAEIGNPYGHFEDRDFVIINKKIIREAGGKDFFPPSINDILELKENFEKQIKNLVSNRKGIWGWKDPRTSLTIPLYMPYLDNPWFIHCIRNEEEVASSLNKRNNLTLEDGKNAKNIYDESIYDFFNTYRINDYLTVDFNDLKSHPEKTIQSISNFLGLECDATTIKNAVKKIKNPSQIKRRKRVIVFFSIFKKIIRKMKRIFSNLGKKND
jgi:hypothetical protein